MVDLIASAFWRRLDVAGHDACQLLRLDDGWRLSGSTVFLHADGPAALHYRVDCDVEWRSRIGRVEGFVGVRTIDASFERVAAEWTMNGDVAPGLDRCEDLDFGFTPATNLTQLRRTALSVGEQAAVPAAWFDVDEAGLSELPQRYELRAPGRYRYEAPRFDYTATLEVGEDGFAELYPGLWERVR